MADNDLSAREIGKMLNAEASRLARLLYPGGSEAGGFWCIGDVHGASGNSLKIRLSGDKQGTWADYACDEGELYGKGDMLKLVMFTVAEQQTIGAAIKWAKGWLGIESMNGEALEAHRRRAEAAQRRAEQRRAGEVASKRRQAEGLWLGSAKLIGTPAMEYLQGRGIDFAQIGAIPGALRFRPDVFHAEKRRKEPVLCSAFWALDGSIAAAHMTFLQRERDGRWIKLQGVEHPKQIWSPAFKGAHIPINKGSLNGPGKGPLKSIPPGTPVYVAEGIEDALTYAMARPDVRIVAAGTLGNIGGLELPPQAGNLILIGQHDAPGSSADRSLEKQIAKQQARAREDGSNRTVQVVWPAVGFKDFNDQLLGKRMQTGDAAHGPQAA